MVYIEEQAVCYMPLQFKNLIYVVPLSRRIYNIIQHVYRSDVFPFTQYKRKKKIEGKENENANPVSANLNLMFIAAVC